MSGAVGTSIFNRCVDCVAMHASRYNVLVKDTTVMERIFADEEAAELDPRQQVIFDFAVQLSKSPPEVSKADTEALIDAGLRSDEILDLVFPSTLFGWANRLMHTLGDAVENEGSRLIWESSLEIRLSKPFFCCSINLIGTQKA